MGQVVALSNGTVLTVRSIESLGGAHSAVTGPARVALGLRGVPADAIRRGDTLTTPDTWAHTDQLDVRIIRPATHDDEPGAGGDGSGTATIGGELVLHVGTAALPVRVRPLGGDIARVALPRPLPLRAGDRAVLRDPGRQQVAAGVLVLDVDPPPLRRRGAAAARAAELADHPGVADAVVELRRRGVARPQALRLLGCDVSALPTIAGWLVDPDLRATWLQRLPELLTDWARNHPLEPQAPRAHLARELGAPPEVLDAVLAERPAAQPRPGATAASSLGPAEAGVAELERRLAAAPFRAPTSDELADLGLDRRVLAAAVRRGRLLAIAPGVVLLPDAVETAVALLARAPQPFTVGDAGRALETSRRVTVPLLELLDKRLITERHKDARRLVGRPPLT